MAKLEQLEQQRAEHEQAIETVKEPLSLRRHTEALGRLDAEIKALYAQLESFAEDDDEEEEEEQQAAAVSATPERRTVGDDELSAPHNAAMPMMQIMVPPSAPLAAPISHQPAFASAPVSVAAAPAPMPSFDDDEPKGGAGKWIVLGLLVIGGLGVGGFFFMQNQKKTEDKPAQGGGGGEVIKASEVPDDTEAPKAAKGADVDRTPTENGGDGGGSAGSSGGKKGDTKKGDTKKVIKLNEGEDPLG
ncbi:hypothetical protein ACNOYE_12495 [Nannocystaceae bacterium ST9]